MSRVHAQYICQSAGNAIISEIGPYRVSSDALQAINQFLDEFLILLLSSSLSLDLSRIKAVVFTLLPSTLGKNAIVEAELEIKTLTETEAIDYESYERMRSLGENGPFPLDAVLPLLRDRCLDFCTLADKEEQDRRSGSSGREDILISPIVAIYVTTVLEHIAEYVLTAIAMTAEHEDTEHIRIKQVFLALIDDVQVGGVFYRMDLREKLEKHAFPDGYRPRIVRTMPFAPQRYSQAPSTNVNGDGFLDVAFDDLDMGYDDGKDFGQNTLTAHDYLSVSGYSFKSSGSAQFRPTSMMSSSTSNVTISTVNSSANSKKTFKLFKKERSDSPVHDYPSHQRSTTPISVSVYDPDAPAMNFEELMRSGNTMKVTLTPNRLRSIEVKDQLADSSTLSKPSWERRSTASHLLKASAPSSRATSPVPAAVKRDAAFDHRGFDKRHMSVLSEMPEETVNAPNTRLGSSPTMERPGTTRYENPRQAPKPPTPQATMSTPLPPPSVSTLIKTPQAKTPSVKTLPDKAPASLPVQPPVSRPEPVRTSSLPVSVPTPKASVSTPPLVQVTKPSDRTTELEPKKEPTVSVPSSPVQTNQEQLHPSNEKEKVPPLPPSTEPSDPKPKSPAEPTAEPAPVPTPVPTAELPPAPASPKKVAKPPSYRSSTPESSESVTLIELPSTPADDRSISDKDTKEIESTDNIKDTDTKSLERKDSKPESIASRDSRDSHDRQASSEHAEHDEHVEHVDQETTKQPERPSSIVAKRASLVGASRRQSLHENYAEKLDVMRNRLSTAGSVENSVKVWDQIVKSGDAVIPTLPVRRRSVRPAWNAQEATPTDSPDEAEPSENTTTSRPTTPLDTTPLSSSPTSTTTPAVAESGPGATPVARPPRNLKRNSVLDVVLKFERASSMDDFTLQHHRQHRASAYIPRRERFLYLQREPGMIERRTEAPKPIRPLAIDAQVQTDPIPVPEPIIITKFVSEPESISDSVPEPLPEPTKEPVQEPVKESVQQPVHERATDASGSPPTLIVTTEDEKSITIHRDLDMETISELSSEQDDTDSDEEWFLAEEDWEDVDEQETTIVEWLLGEA